MSNHIYARYEDVNKKELERDLEKIRENLGSAEEEDFKHLLKLQKWGRAFTIFFTIIIFTAWF